MAQAGLHALVSLPLRKIISTPKWLLLGVVLGSLFPDADNLLVAIATLVKKPTEGLHRTFTHSLFMVVLVVAIFYLVSKVTKRSQWYNLGLGLGLGIFLHIVLDLLLWFNGVAILWPLPSWLNLWSKVTPPAWWMKLMDPLELLLFALFFYTLYVMARKQGSDSHYSGKLPIWIWIEAVLFVVFLILSFVLTKGFLTIFGAVYLLSLGLAFYITIRMRATVDTVHPVKR